MMRRFLTMTAAAALAAVALAAPAAAQFYAGKTITMVINFTAGGPTDIEGRIVARHLDKHIAGKPSIVVKNMPGAGGNTGVNYLGDVAKNDPYSLGFFTWNMINQVLGGEGLSVRYENFKFIAGIRSAVVVFARSDLAPGIKEPKDIAKAANFNAAFLAPDDHSTLRIGLSLDLLGVKHKLIAGYKGVTEVATAVRQNEVQLSLASLPYWRANVEPNMANAGIVTALYQFGRETSDNAFERIPQLPDVKTFLEVYREVHGAGKTPSGTAWESLRFITRMADAMFRTAFLPPGAPKEAVDEMRAAFAKLWTDQEFFAEYEKTIKSRPSLVSGEDGNRIIAGLGNVDPTIVAYLKEYVTRVTR
jgi:tripartite-type tricarboxylate transporter receptor subunit TctC